MFNLKELAEARLARKSKVQPAAETLPAEVKIADSEASQTIPLEQEQVLLVDGTSVAKSVARILESKIETTDGVTHFIGSGAARPTSNAGNRHGFCNGNPTRSQGQVHTSGNITSFKFT